mgnify:CR=1 FL=1
MAKKNNWNADAMQGTLISDMEKEVKSGYQRMGQGGESAEQVTPAQQEETKGIQAYIPMSLYERLVMRKLKTKEPLGSMFVQALRLWIDVQEGKLTVRQTAP